jgi:hypothetical protein
MNILKAFFGNALVRAALVVAFAIALAGTVLAYAGREELCVQPEAGTPGSVPAPSASAPREANTVWKFPPGSFIDAML